MKLNKQQIVAVSVLAAVFLLSGAVPTHAAIVPCGLTGPDATAAERLPCSPCDIFKLLENVIDLALYTGAPIVATLLFLWAGFRIILAGAKPSEIAAGKAIFWNTVWGLVIVFGAWLVANTLLQTLAADQNISGSWFKIECHEAAPVVSPGPSVSQLPGAQACEQRFGLTRADGCANLTDCVNVTAYTTHQLASDDCQTNNGVCLLSAPAAAQAQKLIDKFKELASGSSCTLEIASAIQVNGGPGISSCHKPGNADSGTCADFHVSSHDTCYQYLYQAAKQSGAVLSFLDEYAPECRKENSTGGNVHINFSNGASPAVGAGATCKFSGTDLCQTASTCPVKSDCDQFATAVQQAASRISIPGVNAAALLKAVLYNETPACAANALVTVNGVQSCGIMQLKAATASQFKTQCGVSATITCDWLVAHPTESICLGAQYLQQLASGVCGHDIRNLAVGYNGGPDACQASADCTAQTSCSGGPARQWECLYDDPVHQTCNTGFDDLRGVYAPGVLGCYRANTTQAVATPTVLPPTPAASNDLTPTVYELSPLRGTAGVFSDLTDIGNAMFNDNNLTLTFTGKNLEGATITSDARDISGRPGGLVVNKVRVISSEKVEADVTILPTAKAGVVYFTLKNKYDKSIKVADFFVVAITGNQWLQRQFANNPRITFFGYWGEESAPNRRVETLADSLKRALLATNLPSYQQLNIQLNVYEDSYWGDGSQICLRVGLAGCASPFDRVIEIGEFPNLPDFTTQTIVHESAHKLHFYYSGFSGSRFNSAWLAVVGNIASCRYLPLRDLTSWSNGDDYRVAHCGFITAYAASDADSILRSLVCHIGNLCYAEDVAEATAFAIMEPEQFTVHEAAEVRSDPRYRQKLNLLKQFNFITSSPLGTLTKPFDLGNILSVFKQQKGGFVP